MENRDLPVTPQSDSEERSSSSAGEEQQTPVTRAPASDDIVIVFPDDENQDIVVQLPEDGSQPGDYDDLISDLLPNPGEGGPLPPFDTQPTPSRPTPSCPTCTGPLQPSVPPNTGIQPLPGTGLYPPLQVSYAAVRFLNAAYGYAPFRVFVDNTRVAGLLNAQSVSAYRRVSSGYHIVTVTGTDGYIYLQKTLPFEAGSRSTVAIINRAGGLDLIQISDLCCPPTGRTANFRVSNLAYNSGAMDVLLSDGRVIYADVRFKETTSYKRIAPGAYQFLFAETNLLPTPAYTDIESLDSAYIGATPIANTVATLYLNVQSGTNYTVFLINSGSAYNAISTMVVADR
ncbi:MAG: DUF4397 domain-containing protein [Clostridia bacterium]|nr:DUF4397 domain-containing protein [Clostridia bacterium]